MAREPSSEPTVRSGAIVVGAALALVLVGFAIRHSRTPPPASASATSSAPAPSSPPRSPHATSSLGVPHARSPVVIDGDAKDPSWLAGPARTNAFVAPGGVPAVPYSDARFVWGDDNLYVLLYAADRDIRSQDCKADGPVWLADSFHLAFTSGGEVRSIDVSPLGIVSDALRTGAGAFDYGWQSGARVAHELDGTANDPTDEDEEWLVEMAIPLRALGLRGEAGERIGLSIRRCDTPPSGPRQCGSWGEGAASVELVLE